MRYNVIQWKAKLRAWHASEQRKQIGAAGIKIERQIESFGRLADPRLRDALVRREQAKARALHRPLMVALRHERDMLARYQLIMGQLP